MLSDTLAIFRSQLNRPVKVRRTTCDSIYTLTYCHLFPLFRRCTTKFWTHSVKHLCAAVVLTEYALNSCNFLSTYMWTENNVNYHSLLCIFTCYPPINCIYAVVSIIHSSCCVCTLCWVPMFGTEVYINVCSSLHVRCRS